VKKAEFLSYIGEMLDVPVSEISDDTDLQGLGWDSLASVSFLGLVDEHFDIVVSPKLIAECKIVSDLLQLVAKHIEA
jgi:acyl carrier protein